MIEKVNNDADKSEIKLKDSLILHRAKIARGANKYEAIGGYFQPENFDSSEFTGL